MWENLGLLVGTGMIRLEVRNPVVVSSKTAELVPIPFEDIAALVDELKLSEEAAARLTLSACTLTQWYIMPRALFPGTERAASRERLGKIAEASAALKSELADLGALAAMTLTEAGKDLPGDNDPRFSLMGLQRQLAQLSQAASTALANLPAQNRGNREDPASEMVVRQLVRVTQKATGKPVHASRTKNSIYEPRLKEPGGEFITAWFKRVDPYVGPTALYRMVKKAQLRLRQPGVVDEDTKWLQICELALSGTVTHS